MNCLNKPTLTFSRLLMYIWIPLLKMHRTLLCLKWNYLSLICKFRQMRYEDIRKMHFWKSSISYGTFKTMVIVNSGLDLCPSCSMTHPLSRSVAGLLLQPTERTCFVDWLKMGTKLVIKDGLFLLWPYVGSNPLPKVWARKNGTHSKIVY